MIRGLTLLSFIFFCTQLVGQQNIFRISNGIDNLLAKNINTTKSNFHTAIQPYNSSQIKYNTILLDSFITKTKIDRRKIDFLAGKEKTFISPIGGGEFGINFSNGNYNYITSLGTKIQFSPNTKFGAEISYRYLVGEQETYVDTSVFSKDVIASVGRLGLLKDQNNGLHDLQGYLSYSPNHFFSFLLGKGNHFWGDGYRSFLLSDNASSYPFARIESSFWNVKYTNLYSWQNDISNGAIQNKFSASHHLSWNVTEDINFGLFETVIWAGSDTLINRGFDVNYINPVIFYRPVEYAQGSNDNSIMGLNFKGKIKKQHIIYSQLLLDEFLLAELRSKSNWWGNKYAIQLGYKNYNVFGNPNISFLIERNIARPFTYSHINGTLNYGQLNQSLAHPLGANFKETLAMLSYRHKRWLIKDQINFIAYGADTSTVSMGGNIYKPYTSRQGDFGHVILQGEEHRIITNNLTVSYRLIDAINLKAFGSIIIRSDNSISNQTTDLFIKLGVSTQLWNSYKDF